MIPQFYGIKQSTAGSKHILTRTTDTHPKFPLRSLTASRSATEPVQQTSQAQSSQERRHKKAAAAAAKLREG